MTTQAAVLPFAAPAPSASAQQEAPSVLIERAQKGDVEAFERLMREHERFVYSVARRRLGSREDARDAAQEVFLKWHRHLDRLDPNRPPQGWLYRVTINVCNDMIRRRRGETDLDDEVALQIPDRDPHVDPDAQLALQEQQHMIRRGLRSLSEKERAALLLRDVDGLSTSEAAEALEISEVTIRTHISRGRRKLAQFRERWMRRDA